MKKICIRGAETLRNFTQAIADGFRKIGFEVVDNLPVQTLTQIHGSPLSEEEDVQLLKRAADIYLIHRPDEILLRPKIKNFFEDHPLKKIVLMGDLVLKDPFWSQRRNHITVIPHPFLDLSMPDPEPEKYIMGAFTTWGEMRDVKQFIRLAEEVRALTDKVVFRIGGAGLTTVPGFIEQTAEPFIPHFNVQLYHLNGIKRLGETSGSLHRGISIPIIFEANGAERIEDLFVIKVPANDELSQIDFQQAARMICSVIDTGVEIPLQKNLENARRNTTAHFAQRISDILER